MLSHLGFNQRQGASSHVIFSHPGVPEIINLQPASGGKAKSYQVKQVRDILKRLSTK
jgi:hypothetical protein